MGVAGVWVGCCGACMGRRVGRKYDGWKREEASIK